MKRFTAAIIPLLILLPALAHTQAANKKPGVVMNHLAFHVTSLQPSTSFYTSILGLDTIPEPFHDGKHTWLSLGNGSHLHLIQADGKPTVPGKNTHLCLSVPDVNTVVTMLKQKNLKWEDWPGTPYAITTRVDGVHQLYLQDPDGYWVEINDAKD